MDWIHWGFLICCAVSAVVFTIAVPVVWLCEVRRRSAITRSTEAKRQLSGMVDFLSDFSESFRDYEDQTSTMNSMARYIADLVDAKSVAIYETRFNFLRAAGVYGDYPLWKRLDNTTIDPAALVALIQREKIRIGEGFIGEIAASREAVLVDDAVNDERLKVYSDYANIGSVIAIPMISDQRLHGIIVLAGNRHKKPFGAEEMEMLNIISAQVIMVRTLISIYADRSRQQRLNQELEFARQLQSSMLPQSLPKMDIFELQAYTGSAKEVNGDFYDFVEIDDERLLVVLGDACGKGVPACMLTSMTRSFIRSAANRFTTLEAFLREVNANLYRDTDEERYVTLGCCLIYRTTGIIEYARAGHTDLLVYVLNHMRSFYPEGTGAGVLPDEFATFDTICFELRKGSTLMMFSDGLSEALNEDNEEFGVVRLKQVFSESCESKDTLDVTVNKTLEAVRRFATDQADDQTMILIRRV